MAAELLTKFKRNGAEKSPTTNDALSRNDEALPRPSFFLLCLYREDSERDRSPIRQISEIMINVCTGV